MFNRLDLSRRPANLSLLDLRILPETKMQAALVLRTKAAAARNLLHLLMTIPKQPHFSADRAAITRTTFELETDPLVFRRHVVLVDQHRPSLICDDDVEHAGVPQLDH